ncbi:MAG: zinc-binding dehydrogenase [Candidatus Tectomicrobia bacterium]|uniref:Zinc-binding dehydrogenase n=1 Tax=Tectimicrobiota bacterium TaxID=2528274 RepID=A0A932MLZ6_UNCTE|nr:zinc-binding dehydrogenase [Candidatus Tectomicrobia bacterium]
MTTPRTMQAVVLHEPNRYSFEAGVPVPEAGPQEALCRVGAVAICGTDIGIISGKFFPMWPPRWPFIIGHEWAGVVEEVGPGAGFSPGDKVAGSSAVGCGHCRNCMRGRYNLCLNYGNTAAGHRQYGFTVHGAYAQYIRAHARSLVKLPPDFDLGEASLMDTAGIALHIAKRGGVGAGDTAVVIGPGAVGSIACQCARALGAGRVIVVGRGHRLAKARELGFETVDYEKADPLAYVKEATGGVGPDVVLECAGTARAVRQAVEMVKKGGRVVIGGLPAEDVPLPLKRFVLDEIEVVGSRAAPNCLPEVLALVQAGALRLRELVTHRFPLSDFQTALATFQDRSGGALKVVVEP